VFTVKKPSINDLELSSSVVITVFLTAHVIIHGFKHGTLYATFENYKIRMFGKALQSLCTFHLV